MIFEAWKVFSNVCAFLILLWILSVALFVAAFIVYMKIFPLKPDREDEDMGPV